MLIFQLKNGLGTSDSFILELDGSTYNISGSAIDIDSSENIYAGGTSSDDGNNSLLVKLSSTGALIWQRLLGSGSGSNESVRDVAVDSSGNIYVGINTSLLSPTASNASLLLKYNSSGVLQWQRTVYTNTTYFAAQGMTIDPSGNVYICGSSNIAAHTGGDAVVVSYDTNGVYKWGNTYYHSSRIGGYVSIARSQTSSSLHMTGNNQVINKQRLTMHTVNSAGTLTSNLDVTDINVNDSMVGSGIATGPGGIWTIGYMTTTSNDIIINKWSDSNTISWTRKLSGIDYDQGISIAVDSLNNSYAIGRSLSQGEGGYDLVIAKINNSGTIQWQRTLGSVDSDWAGRVRVSDDFIYIIGTASGTFNKMMVIKLPTDGSDLGTYGNGMIYQESTFVFSSVSTTQGSSSWTKHSQSFTDAASSLTDETGVTSLTKYVKGV